MQERHNQIVMMKDIRVDFLSHLLLLTCTQLFTFSIKTFFFIVHIDILFFTSGSSTAKMNTLNEHCIYFSLLCVC